MFYLFYLFKYQLMFIIAFEEGERNTNPPKKKLDLVSIYLLSKN